MFEWTIDRDLSARRGHQVSYSDVMMGRLRDPVLRAVAPCGIPPTGAREK